MQHIRESQNAESKKLAFCKLHCLPLAFLLTPTLYLHAIFTEDMGLHYTDKKMLASGIWFLRFLLDLCLINISCPLKDLSIKLSLMINGSRVNKICGICKWLCLVCCLVPSLISHEKILHGLDTEEREVDMKAVPAGLCSCKLMLEWELTLQLIPADVLSKGTAKLTYYMTLRNE